MVQPNFSDKSTTANPPNLLDQVRDKLRVKQYSIRTEHTYVDWIKRYIFFHGRRHPKDLEARDLEAFLTHLAVAGKVSASTQNQAKSALLFLYREVLEIKLPWLDNGTQAKAPKRLPVVLTVSEVQAVLSRLSGTHALIASLLYGGGMRLMEAVRLRVKDVEFARHEIVVREGKGFKDRVTMLPEAVVAPLKAHLAKVKALHDEDLAHGHARCTCLSRRTRNIPTPGAIGAGSTCSRPESVGRSALGQDAPPSCGRERCAARGEAGGARCGADQACHAAHPAAFLCDPPAAGRLRHPHGTGAARPFGCFHHDDLHSRAEQGRQGRGEPFGQVTGFNQPILWRVYGSRTGDAGCAGQAADCRG